MKIYTTREFKKLLLNNGYIKRKSTGGHTIYEKNGKHISVNNKINRMVCRRLIKENDLKER